MVMRYHWGRGVGHTYSHPCPGARKESSHDTQTDVEMGPVTQEILPQASRSIPSKNPATNHPNNKNDGDEVESGTSDDHDTSHDDSENYDEYDDDDDDYHYREDDDEDEKESEDTQSDDSDDLDG
jgi:hypothetical protein